LSDLLKFSYRNFVTALFVAFLLPLVGGAQTSTPGEPAPQAQSGSTGTSPSPTDTQATGWIGFAQVQSSHNILGTVLVYDADAGYALTEHFAVSIGIPLIMTRSPFSPVTNHDYHWTTLIGSPYLDVKYTNTFQNTKFISLLTGKIPATNEDRTFSTGRFGVDWFNHLEKEWGGLTPFLNFGASNGAVDRFNMPRPYSEARPYQSLGFLADFEGGVEFKRSRGFAKGIGIGGSGYVLVPAGPQKVFSRYVVPYSTLGGDGQHFRYFDANFETKDPSQAPTIQTLALTAGSGTFDGCSAVSGVVSCRGGRSSIARDNGFSGWLDVTRGHPIDVQFGYTRSIHYHLDTYTVTINFDARSLIKSLMPQ
jgi:hypothetical protein